MDVKKEISNTIKGSLKRFAKKHQLPIGDLRIQITCDENDKLSYQLYQKTRLIEPVLMSDILGLQKVMKKVIDPMGKQKKVTEFLDNLFRQISVKQNIAMPAISIIILVRNSITEPEEYLLFANKKYKHHLDLHRYIAA